MEVVDFTKKIERNIGILNFLRFRVRIFKQISDLTPIGAPKSTFPLFEGKKLTTKELNEVPKEKSFGSASSKLQTDFRSDPVRLQRPTLTPLKGPI